jgi:uncharacterized membrane protein
MVQVLEHCNAIAMLYAFLKTLHVLSIVVWVGGMVFAHFFLRPAASALEPPQRLTLMHGVLRRFFTAITYLSLLALFTGFWMMGSVAKAVVQGGGEFTAPVDWTVMALLGTLMVLIFGHIRFALYGRLSKAVTAADWPAAGVALDKIRQWVLVNLSIGVVIIAVTLLM